MEITENGCKHENDLSGMVSVQVAKVRKMEDFE